MGEIIRGKVSEVDRQSHAITSGSIEGNRHRVKGNINTTIQIQSSFKLENDSRTFSFHSKALIEIGDELAFEYEKNNYGFFDVFNCKNLTKDYVIISWTLGMIFIAIFKIILYSIFLLIVCFTVGAFVLYYLNSVGFITITKSQEGIYIFACCCIGFILWVFGLVYILRSIHKKKLKKFLQKI